MEIPLSRCAFGSAVVVALLAGCSGFQSPLGAPDVAASPIGYRLVSKSIVYEVLYRFEGGYLGAFPEASLINLNGTLYGTTTGSVFGAGCSQQYACGNVFSISTTTGNEKVLYSFQGGSDGQNPYASLIDVDGTLYGTTEFGGGYGGGTVFSVTTAGKEKVLYRFGTSEADGTNPLGGLIDVNGMLYGTTTNGGAHSGGTVFSVTTTGTERVLYSFCSQKSCADGEAPTASLLDVKSTLYGTTYRGGKDGGGTIFSVTAAGKEKVLHTFGGSPDGSLPYASLISVNGTLYGTTSSGGANGIGGTVFSVTTTGAEKVLSSFCARSSCSDGENPYASLLNVNGTLYGTTGLGGDHEDGTAFSVTTAGKRKVLHSFAGIAAIDGAKPWAALINVQGTLYGTTSIGGTSACGGGNGCGTVFLLRP